MTRFTTLLSTLPFVIWSHAGLAQNSEPTFSAKEMEIVEQAYVSGDLETARIGLEEMAPLSDNPVHWYRLGYMLINAQGGPLEIDEGIVWLRKAAETGHNEALLGLGKIYLNGEGVTADPALAEGFLRQAAEKDEREAQLLLARLYLQGAPDFAPNLEASLTLYNTAAEAGNPQAQFALALLYGQDQFGIRDNEKSLFWLGQAADNGDVQAQFNLARNLESGFGIAQDPEAAIARYRQAAQGGHVTAQRIMGAKYLLDEIPEPIPGRAMTLLEAAALTGDAAAQSNLGYAFATGTKATRNDVTAAGWYQMAADQGFSPATAALGSFYETGRGVEVDLEKAATLYRIAAGQGNAQAAAQLGGMVANGSPATLRAEENSLLWVLTAAVSGNDTATDWLQAQAADGNADAKGLLAELYIEGHVATPEGIDPITLLKESATQGFSEAQHRLGAMYVTGESGLPADYLSAYMWHNLAAARGYQQSAEARDLIAKLMTPEQISEAQTMTRKHLAEQN
ncbi:MAG: SEL1-like repeat protein [Pseudoruegeria sp.]